MRGIPRRLPSPALIVACVALAVALSGAGYAAVTLPRGSVGTAQLKRSAVIGSKVKNDALTGLDVKESSLAQVPSAAKLGGLAANGIVRVASATQAASVTSPVGTGHATGASVTIAAPGPGYVLVTGAIDIRLGSGASTLARVWLEHDLALSQILLNSLTSGQRWSVSPTHVFTVPAAGAYTYSLMFRAGGAPESVTGEDGTITALYVPFGANG